jgi:hypothetical protein
MSIKFALGVIFFKKRELSGKEILKNSLKVKVLSLEMTDPRGRIYRVLQRLSTDPSTFPQI